jgi:hypothetical protein
MTQGRESSAWTHDGATTPKAAKKREAKGLRVVIDELSAKHPPEEATTPF